MSRIRKWNKGEYQIFKLKLKNEKAEAYKNVLKSKVPKRNIQNDFEQHVEKIIN